jgi:hypothetical protein
MLLSSARLAAPVNRSFTRAMSSLPAARRALKFERVRTRIVVDRDNPDIYPDQDDDAGDPASEHVREWLTEDDLNISVRRLSTLDPAHLTPADYISLSYHTNPSLSFIPRTSSFPIRFFRKNGEYQPFPQGTRGFLYYHAPRQLPPMAGAVRFRITPGSHPSTFPDGVDLLRDGLPWEISLPTLAAAVGRKEVLREQLLLEGLVSQADLAQCRAAAPTKKRLDSKIALYTLNQPFPIAFHQMLNAWVVGKTQTRRWAYAYMFADNRAQFRPLVRPYTGAYHHPPRSRPPLTCLPTCRLRPRTTRALVPPGAHRHTDARHAHRTDADSADMRAAGLRRLHPRARRGRARPPPHGPRARGAPPAVVLHRRWAV